MTVPALLPILTCLLFATIAPALLGALRYVRHTTLKLAWAWAAAGWCVWVTVLAMTCVWKHVPTGLADQLWYVAGLLLPCPPIAVLGAKRPMSRAWSGFVLAPLVCVLGWPVVSNLAQDWRATAWALEEPVFAGYVFILVMGLGNHVGTRFVPSAALWGLAGLAITAPLCPSVGPWGPPRHLAPALAIAALAGSAWCGWLALRRPYAGNTPMDRAWAEFSTLFGLVWSRRLQDRFNEMARQSGLAVRLGPHGFEREREEARPGTVNESLGGHSAPSAFSPQPQELAETQWTETLTPAEKRQAEQILRWLLRRFVDDAWIDSRLQHLPVLAPK